jgi:hypothetical protein
MVAVESFLVLLDAAFRRGDMSIGYVKFLLSGEIKRRQEAIIMGVWLGTLVAEE